MPPLSAKFTDAQTAKLRDELKDIADTIPAATAGALNRTADQVATKVRRSLAGLVGLGVRKVGKAVRSIGTDKVKLRAGVRILDYNVRSDLVKKDPSKGGMYALKRSGPLESIVNTPFKQMVRGKQGWYVRHGQKRVMTYGRYKKRIRQPIAQIYYPSPLKVWDRSPSVQQEILADIPALFDKNIDSQIQRFTK